MLWSQVGSCDLAEENTKMEQLLIGVWSKRGDPSEPVKIGCRGFSASGPAIWELMNAHWKAYWATVPPESGAKPDTGKNEAQELQSIGPLDWKQ
jgi:hypothetical protein